MVPVCAESATPQVESTPDDRKIIVGAVSARTPRTTSVIVTYHNTTTLPVTRASIECTLVGKSGELEGAADWDLREETDGVIAPGGKRTKDLYISNSDRFDGAACKLLYER